LPIKHTFYHEVLDFDDFVGAYYYWYVVFYYSFVVILTTLFLLQKILMNKRVHIVPHTHTHTYTYTHTHIMKIAHDGAVSLGDD
jgi:hypothetical protein